MALGEVQAALARLFTDEAARAAFSRDPRGAARALGLGEADAATLAGLAPQALRRFAGGLSAKRALDARKIMPLTAQALGEAFTDHWRAALASAGAGRVEEARALAARLAALANVGEVEPPWIGDVARYEAAFVEAAHSRFGLRLRLFRFPVATIAGALFRDAAVGDIALSATLGVWARRPGGRLRHRTWRLNG